MRIENEHIKVETSKIGAGIQNLLIGDSDFGFQNIALSFQNPALRKRNSLYAGATLAPTAGRIKSGLLMHNDGCYQLALNENSKHHLHGGFHNLSFTEWKEEACSAHSVSYSAFLPDGIDGYPGNRTFTVSYVVEPDTLIIRYKAVSDIPTYINFSNHTYFNLNNFSKDGLHQFLQIQANQYIANNEEHIPQKIENVHDSPFDFQNMHTLKEMMDRYSEDSQLTIANGYNQHFLFTTQNDLSTPKLTLTSYSKKMQMHLFTDAPAFVLYSGGYIDHTLLYQVDSTHAAPMYPGCAIAIEPCSIPSLNGFVTLSRSFERTIKYVFSYSPSVR